ncbi:MAG: hypothetical protein VYD45_15420 [Pseudomonadota bacterium]|jgi:hypothetical protein|nr:hypothetical protein [Pseudomonadota bacterium]WVM89307.1 hypothetical protein UMZ34_00970 [Halopseudomonas pachastrellae]
MNDDDELSPLAAGAATLPPTLGEGCLMRFDPAELSEDMGADFSDLPTESD